jgi:hypothetical protein
MILSFDVELSLRAMLNLKAAGSNAPIYFPCSCRDVGVSIVFMRLITAHRILIATSVVFFFGFSYWQLARYLQSGDGWALLQAVVYLLAAIVFGVYFVNIKKWYR